MDDLDIRVVDHGRAGRGFGCRGMRLDGDGVGVAHEEVDLVPPTLVVMRFRRYVLSLWCRPPLLVARIFFFANNRFRLYAALIG